MKIIPPITPSQLSIFLMVKYPTIPTEKIVQIYQMNFIIFISLTLTQISELTTKDTNPPIYNKPPVF